MNKNVLRYMVLALLLMASLSTYAYNFEVNGIYYTITSSSELTCEVTTGDNDYTGDITIPATVDHGGKRYRVTNIDVFVFRQTKIRSVVIGNNVTGIGFEAFYNCLSLTSVVIGNSVTGISHDAFKGCTRLSSVVFGKKVSGIGDSAFEGCTRLTSVDLPDGVTGIGTNAFWKCTSLTSVNIPDSVTSIGNSAFWGCI